MRLARRSGRREAPGEAAPVVLVLFAIALPLGLIVLAAMGGGLAVTALALAAMALIVAVGSAFIERLTTRNPDGGDKRR